MVHVSLQVAGLHLIGAVLKFQPALRLVQCSAAVAEGAYQILLGGVLPVAVLPLASLPEKTS